MNAPEGNDPRLAAVRSYRPIGQIIPEHWTSGDVLANGISQRYYRTGAGRPPLVLLHGFMEGALAWLPTARALQSAHDVIMLDARGHGHSARIAGDFTSDTLVADVAAALRSLGLERANLLGFSQGASTAALLADRHPNLVSRLILAGMAEGTARSADPQNPGYQAWLKGYTTWLKALKGQSHAERMIAGLAQLPPQAPLLPEDDYVSWVENSANLDLDLVELGERLWGALSKTVEEMRAAIQRLSCPTLILKSGLTPYSSGPLELRQEPSGRPNVTMVRFENTGHLIHRDRFDAFITQVRAFLTRG